MVQKNIKMKDTLYLTLNSAHIFYSFHLIRIKFSTGNVYKNLMHDVRFMNMGTVKGILYSAA